MNLLERLFGPASYRYQSALSRTTERFSLLTTNMANQSTPGYKRKDSDFSLSLSEAGINERRSKLTATHPLHLTSTNRARRRSDFHPSRINEDARSLRSDGNNVDLEKEVAAMVETQLHYNAISLFARRHFQGLKDVIKEGRS